MNDSLAIEKRELEWDVEEEMDRNEPRIVNLESLAGSPGVFKIGSSSGHDGVGKIEKVPREIKARSAPDPFRFRKKTSGMIGIRSAFD